MAVQAVACPRDGVRGRHQTLAGVRTAPELCPAIPAVAGGRRPAPAACHPGARGLRAYGAVSGI